jgi:hypothetical protein
MWTFQPFGSHLPVICRCFAEMEDRFHYVNGHVLELGCGDFSTPMLHELCSNKFLTSLDTDAGWLNKMLYLFSPHHDIRYVPSWENLPEYGEYWDIVLVDQTPGEYRRTSVEALADRAHLIICHDTETIGNIYGYQYCLDKFKYRVEYKQHPTFTTVVSNSIDVSHWW